jgi:hypothetical protein
MGDIDKLEVEAVEEAFKMEMMALFSEFVTELLQNKREALETYNKRRSRIREARRIALEQINPRPY